MSFNMRNYKRRPSQANEAINILRNPSISVEPGSALQQQIAALASAKKNTKQLDSLKETGTSAAEASTWKSSIKTLASSKKIWAVTLLMLAILAGIASGIYVAKKAAENQGFPKPPNVEELPSNNCSAFTKAGNIPGKQSSYHKLFIMNKYSIKNLDGGLITVQGRITFLAHERSFPTLIFNDTEMIQLVCDTTTAEKIRPYTGSLVKITGKKYACSLLLANGTRPIPVKPTATATVSSNPTATPTPFYSKGPRKMALVFFYFEDDAEKPFNEPQSLTDAVFDPYDGMNALFK